MGGNTWQMEIEPVSCIQVDGIPGNRSGHHSRKGNLSRQDQYSEVIKWLKKYPYHSLKNT
jgi:hypothetical protein